MVTTMPATLDKEMLEDSAAPRRIVSRRRRQRRRLEGTPADWLFQLRQQRGLTLKDVEQESFRISRALNNERFCVSAARLSQIENGSSVPSIFKLATLSWIYETEYAQLLRAYGIPQSIARTDQASPGLCEVSGG